MNGTPAGRPSIATHLSIHIRFGADWKPAKV